MKYVITNEAGLAAVLPLARAGDAVLVDSANGLMEKAVEALAGRGLATREAATVAFCRWATEHPAAGSLEADARYRETVGASVLVMPFRYGEER